MGANSGQNGRSAGRQRLGLALFGGLLVLLFAGFAVVQGVAHPSVPDGDVAIVEDVPAGDQTVSAKEFARALAQQVAQGETKKVPKEGTEQYEELKEAALGELLDLIWIQGEAEEMGISVTDKQVADELEQIKEQNFPTPKAFAEFLKTSKFTKEDVNNRVRLQLLSTQIQELVNSQAGTASNEEIADYYEAAKAQFTTGPSRDIRVLTNKSKAKAEKALEQLEADSSPASWEKVAKKFSEDPSTKGNGGLQEGLTEETLPEPLKGDIFGAAAGDLIGPVKFQGNFTVIEVVKENPEKTQSLGEVRSQVSTQLTQQAQQAYFNEFVAEYQSKWRSRTFCASGFVITRCANYVGDGHPASAPPGCYEEDPKEGEALECPAPVVQPAPAVPGSVSVLQPQGERLPQRPVPVPGAEPEAPGGPEGVLPESAGGE